MRIKYLGILNRLCSGKARLATTLNVYGFQYFQLSNEQTHPSNPSYRDAWPCVSISNSPIWRGKGWVKMNAGWFFI
ncbi:hypothetical protein KsCSTR_31070 [Candidatus Kuenenia stuttgartiensis]|uniref:Uncharacterized protein n=1 Tax=Kuenenia stuttgartiensis TaxID=174633 RepID=Q1Q531_KUEST|nr:hypothetical protein KsCSTR_31070 [Candidatus Kuenenia stuttgartiensis]CAJ75114.1 unknown protein [Candidatus Kuenenia stuttgartiensis]